MSLKVVMFVMFTPFVDSRIMNEVTALSEDGFEVIILALGKPSESQALVEVSPNLRVEHVFLMSRSLPAFAPFLLVKYLELCLRVLVKSWVIHADIHLAYDLPALPTMWLASRIRSSLLVFDASELYFDRLFVEFRWLWRPIQSWLLRKTDLVFAANEARARVMHDEYGAPTLPVVIHNYPPYHEIEDSDVLRRFVAKSGRNWNHILLHQGGILPDRAANEIIQTLKFVSRDAGVVFLGSVAAEYKEDLLKLAESQNVADRVLFHPAVSLEELPRYTVSATLGLVLYLNISRNNYFCAPNKLYAYLMAGIPVVGSDFPGLRADIVGNQVGVVADPQAPDALAAAINLLLEDQETRSAMGLRAKKLAKEQWNWEKERIRLQGAYHDLIQRNSHGRL